MRRHARAPRGFTLVELLVALFVLSLVAVLSWRGLDGMMRTQAQTQERADKVLALQVGLAQWQADLDAIVQLPQQTALQWNGRVLRMTRHSPAGTPEAVVVAAWSLRDTSGQGLWMRWQSPPLTTRAQVEQAWQRADLWSQSQGDAERTGEIAVVPLTQWQLFFFRGDAWTNPQSSDATQTQGQPPPPARPNAAVTLPDGVRALLTLPAGQPVSGVLTLDWVGPRVAAGRP